MTAILAGEPIASDGWCSTFAWRRRRAVHWPAPISQDSRSPAAICVLNCAEVRRQCRQRSASSADGTRPNNTDSQYEHEEERHRYGHFPRTSDHRLCSRRLRHREAALRRATRGRVHQAHPDLQHVHLRRSRSGPRGSSSSPGRTRRCAGTYDMWKRAVRSRQGTRHTSRRLGRRAAN